MPLDHEEESTTSVSTAPPRRWGSLELREILGQGAFGTVYRAWDPNLDKEVALKILRPMPDAGTGDALLTEARRLARVRHPHVVTVHGADIHDGSVGFWMELVNGVTLEAWLRTHGMMSAEEAAILGTAMTQALAAVHGSGLVHGDVKARNIVRENGGRYVLTDFGASRALEAMRGDSTVRTIGTPLYMAPEVLRGSRPTLTSDIYSLGVLLFHCVTGKYPVQGSTMERAAASHREGQKAHLRDLRPDLPRAFVKVVECAINPDPAARFQTAGAMELALAEVMQARARASRVVTTGLLLVLGVMGVGAATWALNVGLFAPATAVDVASIQTVAILPFEGTGGNGGEAFGRGFTDMLTTRLSEIDSLRIVSPTSARLVRAQAAGLPDIGRMLSADALVEGSVQIVEDRVRVVVRLVHAATDSVLWSEALEDRLGDVLGLQSRLAVTVALQLRDALTEGQRQRLSGAETTRPEAQAAYLEGWASLETQTVEGVQNAVKQFQAAIDADPAYARAHAMLSHAYFFLSVQLNAMPPGEAERLARAAATRALELDPQLPRAHTAIGQVAFYFDWDWPSGESAFATAVRLDPSDADAHQQYGWFLAAQGRLDEAVSRMRRARELDPLSPTRRSPLAAVLYYSRLYPEAVQELNALVAASPTFRAGHVGLARCYSALGRTDDALKELEVARNDSAQFLAELGRVHAQAGDIARAEEILRSLEAQRVRDSESVRPESLAILHAALGSTDMALGFVEEAHAARIPAFLWIKVNPRYDALRLSPRFQRVLSAMKLAD